jgi:hypothetical protein
MSEVDEVTEEVVDQALSFAEASPDGDRHLGLAFGAFVVGAGLGGVLGYFLTRHKLETKYNEIAEAEIAEMRQHYQDKATALENTVAKPQLDALVREQGYTAEPPMAVTPPTEVVEAAKEAVEEAAEPKKENVFEKPPVTEAEVGMPLVEDEWDYKKELARRSPVRPYVIHRDERDEYEAYDTVTYTYYDEDDVLCNERDEVIGKEDRDRLIGEANLEKFGHGSGDASIVYIRNDREETQMEVVRSPNSYAEEVHGLQHSESLARRHRRGRGRPSLDDD